MRVAHVNTELGFSGGERQLFLLLEGLREAGHTNLLLCRPGGRVEVAAREARFEVDTVPMSNDFDLPAVLRLRALFRAHRPDLVHLHSGRATWLGGLGAKLAGIPALTTRRMDRRVKRNLRSRFIYGSLVQKAVAISTAVADCLREGGVAEDKVVLIRSSIDPTQLAPSASPQSVREAEGVSSDTRLLLLPASLDHRKGIDVLLEALALLAKEHALHPTLWLAGTGPQEEAIENRIARLGLDEQVQLLGQRQDIPDLLAACDLFVLPSRREGLGVAALEAMAAGKPVIASRVGGLGEAVVHEGTGLLVEPEDAPALAEAIARLLDDAALRARLGAAGPARIAELYLARDMVRSYERLYASILGMETSEADPLARESRS